MTNQLNLAEVNRTRATPDPVLRNLRITQFYHEASAAIRDLTGRQDVSWFAFGAWASSTAGEFIRGEEVPPLSRELLEHNLPGHLDDLIREFLASMSSALAQGNLLVFDELGPIAVAFIDTLRNGRPLDSLLDSLGGQLSPNGQPLVSQAVTAWRDAAKASDASTRAQLMLLANCSAVYHEQQRLQPLLAEAMALPVVDELAKRLAGETEESWLERRIERRLGPLVVRIREDWREFNTRLVMQYELPGESLRLGRDVQPAVPGVPFPAPIATLTLQPLVELWNTVAGIPGLAGSAADDWLDLRQRMRFISTLFRAHQQNARLFDPPFTEIQVKAIANGIVPVEFRR